jgi:rfaE bifunctional protein nucleotidyltransferase chain/domain
MDGEEKMEQYRLKVKQLPEIKKEIDRLKAQGKTIVFTNGCFDLLHPGHARYLWAAKQSGDYLVVAVNSDRSVRSIKGQGRPVVSEEERAEMVAALACVDGVVIFDEDTPLRVIEYLLPDVLVKGGDWQEDQIVGADVVKKAGGTVKRIPFVAGYSTSAMLSRIKNS